MKLSLTLDLTAENIEKLKMFLPEAEIQVEPEKAKPKAEKPKAEKPAAVEPEQKEEPAEVEEAPKEEAPKKEAEEVAVTKADVRNLGLQLTKAGKSDVLKSALADFGAEKLGAVKPEDYAALYERLQEEINNG